MKNIFIDRIQISNFKKIQSMIVDFNSKNVEVYGKNESGKSTIIDAFFWCLFGKNQYGDTKFNIKPIIGGKELHNIATSVEITLVVDGFKKVLCREMVEVWTKKRGSSESVFSGHTTNYFINGVNKSEKDYKAEISLIVPEEKFKLLTNVNAFTSLSWKEQRKVLFDIIDASLSQEEILEQVTELRPLKEELDKFPGMSVDEMAIKQKGIMKKNNEVLEKTPIEIETLRGINYNIEPTFDAAEANHELMNLNERKETLIKAKADSNKNLAFQEYEELITDLQDKVMKLEREKREIDNTRFSREKLEVMNYETTSRGLKTKLESLKAEKETLETRILNGEKLIQEKEELKDKYYAEYDEIYATRFVAEKCAACGQDLPQDQLERLESKFNLDRAEKLAKNIEKGKANNAEIEKYKAAIEKFKNDKQVLEIDINNLNTEIQSLSEPLKVDYTEEEKQRLESLNSRIADEKAREETVRSEYERAMKFEDRSSIQRKYNDEIAEIDEKIRIINSNIAEFELMNKNKLSILEKEKKMKLAANEFELAESLLILCEKFTKIRAELIQDKCNNNFDYVSFKLFEEQINGGINEACTLTVNGVPYLDVNTAGKIHAGLDIIKKIQNKYGINAPIFMDNCECLSSWKIDMGDTQLVRFYVSNDESLLFNVER